MITEAQNTEIRNYLLTKNLPIDILMEIEDHFILQIAGEMERKNLSFEMAFLNTKNSWADELSLEIPFYILVNRNDAGITKFESRVKRDAQCSNFKLALLAVLLLMGFLLAIVKLFEVSNYMQVIRMSSLLCMAFAFLPIFYNSFFYSFAYKKKYQKFKFSVYHDRIMLVFSFVFFMQMFLKPYQEWIPALLNFDFSAQILLQLLRLLSMYFALIYTGIWQIKFAKRMSEIKHFLKFM